MQKPTIFISHITQEKELAKIIKDELERAFLGLLEIFVSSDGESIQIGKKWLDEIDQALRESQIILLLCSKSSVTRPWVNFEAGAGWVKGIPIIPICHTNLTPVDLPLPLNMLQGVQVTSKDNLEKIFQLIGRYLGVKTLPEIQYDRIIEEIKSFEKRYKVIEVVKREVKSIIEIEPQLLQVFVQSRESNHVTGFLKEIVVDKLLPHFKVLQEMGMLTYGLGGNKLVISSDRYGQGNQVEINLVVSKLYYEIAEEVMS